jgi:hypothetical protein
MPNLPPSNWITNTRNNHINKDETLKMVYIGALSLRDTYIESLMDWFQRLPPKKARLDLYINNTDAVTLEFLRKYESSQITLHRTGVPYDQLPLILPNYDIGLILYRCNSVNYVYNAPNKLFEYLICGLNVLYPQLMIGVAPYAREDTTPWVKPVDFNHLQDLSIEEITHRDVPYKPWTGTCEAVYEKLLTQMLSAPPRG